MAMLSSAPQGLLMATAPSLAAAPVTVHAAAPAPVQAAAPAPLQAETPTSELELLATVVQLVRSIECSVRTLAEGQGAVLKLLAELQQSHAGAAARGEQVRNGGGHSHTGVGCPAVLCCHHVRGCAWLRDGLLSSCN